MAVSFQTVGIIIQKKPIREKDSIISVYTPDRGLIDLIVRGGQKQESKLSGHSEPITLSSIMIIPGRNWNYLGSAVNEVSFLGIKNDLEKIDLVSLAFKRVLEFSPREMEDSRVFELLCEFLYFLDKNTLKVGQFILDAFLLKLWVLLGYEPDFSQYSDSNQLKEKMAYDLQNNQLLCYDNHKAQGDLIVLSKETVRLIIASQKNNFADLNNLDSEVANLAEINNFVSLLLKY